MGIKFNIELGQNEEGIHKNLEAQLKRIAKHNRQGSYKTRERYYEATHRFCKFLAKKFRLQKLVNVQSKHIVVYVTYLQENNYSPGTIKTELSAIRFFMDKLGNSNPMPTNENLHLEKRQRTGVPRAWNLDEYETFLEVCKKAEENIIAKMAVISREQGLRIHEVARLDRNSAEKALRTGKLEVKGKGGKIRTVVIIETVRELLKDHMRLIQRGEKLFIQKNQQTHEFIKEMQEFINDTRSQWQDSNSTVNKSFHGLRHAYAKEGYAAKLKKGETPKQSRLGVARELGHGRDEVTRTYIGY